VSRGNSSEKGQSLVEMALITPVLIIMMMGLFEVGYALRTYMVLLQANREAARFLAKEVYNHDQGAQQFLYAASALDLDWDDNLSLQIQTATPAYTNPFVLQPEPWFASDTYGVVYTFPVNADFVKTKAVSLTVASNVAIYDQEVRIRDCFCNGNCADNTSSTDPPWLIRQRSCTVLAKLLDNPEQANLRWMTNNVILVETHYTHEQLLGFFGQYKIPMYVHTYMRAVPSRGWMNYWRENHRN
jgi:Flp pilus assembly protein TadG